MNICLWNRCNNCCLICTNPKDFWESDLHSGVFRKEVLGYIFPLKHLIRHEDGAHDNFYKFVPKVSETASYIHKCLDIGKKNKVAHWHIRYISLCYFKDYLDQISELDEATHFQIEHLAPDFGN